MDVAPLFTVPHAAAVQLDPVTTHVTVGKGLPEPVTTAAKFCRAPSSTLAVAGCTATATSLITVTWALASRMGSAWLAAVTVTTAGECMIWGAV